MKKFSPVYAFIPICRNSKRPAEALAELQRRGLTDVSLENKLEIRNEGETTEIVLIGAVGKSWWDDSGITEKEFRDALKTIPKGRPIQLTINSEGGSVQEGLGIYNAIKERAADITARISGYAISIASVFPLAAHKVISPKSAIWMTHKAWSYAQGNDEDFERAAEMLREHNETLVDIYAAETGKTKDEWRKWMADETWIRGSKAIEFGLADETDEDVDAQAAYRPLHPDFIQRCKNLSPEILNAISPKQSAPKQGRQQEPQQDHMNKTIIVALLKEHGIDASETESEEQLQAKLQKIPKAATPAPAKNDNTLTKDELAAAIAAMERKAEVKAELAKLVAEKRITQAQADKALPAALKDDSVLAMLRENPVMPEVAAQVDNTPEVQLTGDASIADVAAGIRKTHEATKSLQRGNAVDGKILAASSVQRAQIIRQHAEKLRGVLAAGTNTIDSALQRDVILQVAITDFARRLLPLTAFSTVFQNVPLQGTNKVQVPYFDLESAASTSFKSTDGYVAGDTTNDNREIQIGKRATADVNDATKKYDRKYQSLQFTSEELARQPYLSVQTQVNLKADKLASDILTHVLGIVTEANYGAAAVTKAAVLFNSEDVADLKAACKAWPEMGRSLILDSAYDAALLKDNAIKGALNYGGAEAIREGRIPQLFGFNYREIPTIPSNNENLVGFAVFMSAILYAQAPVPPLEEVRRAGTNYSIVTDPATGISFEYRSFGDGQMDSGTHVIEASYGFAKGNGNALKRIVSA